LRKRSGIPVFDKWLTIAHIRPLAGRLPILTCDSLSNGDLGISPLIEPPDKHFCHRTAAKGAV
jgi:hypothetical protein